jgi:hypothetical protein
MAEILNLRRARKEKASKAAAERAANNRVRFGRTKSERMNDAAEHERIAALLDGSRRETK